MGKQNNIYVKIQIEKDDLSGNLALRTQFDVNAPNFFQDNDQISWCPTTEEIEFLNETFNLISTKKRKSCIVNNNDELSIVEETIDTISKEKKNDSMHQESEQLTGPLSQSPPLQADAGGIIVSSDAKALDEIIKRKEGREGVMVEADEETIVDKVLKQKKKGVKW
ncbi:MAG: hypothetical protein NT038_08330 [Euryarchaeota archaeon]|nr:hypothetical protein [Euryarchaeota archaeon]